MFRNLLFITLFIAHAFTGNAQKLANVQVTSVFAPGTVKIDGKFLEWGNRPQAYNSATEISYTMANDDDNLYFIAQVTNGDVITKILRGGLTLAIQKSGKRNDQDAPAIVYPITDTPFSVAVTPYRMGKVDTSAEAGHTLMRTNNGYITRRIKSIRVKGISGVDTLLSIYNQDGIKAACMFDDKLVYTLEMCLPLKYLQLSTTEGAKFSYHVILNGFKPPSLGQPTDRFGKPATSPTALRVVASFELGLARRSAPTDLWGEYTLAKR